MNSTLHSVLLKLEDQNSLTAEEMTGAMEAVISGKAADPEIEQFLLLLRKKGETAAEIAAAVKVMRDHALKLSKHYDGLLDTCGTGGDGSHTLNVSTVSALVACAAGIPVAKHGNRSVSSVCGSADLLELLGVPIDLSIQAIETALEKVGFAFLFAPSFHPATRFAMPARKRIQGKTIFNILGPLSNPAGVDFQIVGVYEKKLVALVAKALLELGLKHALVVHGADGLDEISIADRTFVAELKHGKLKHYEISPEETGIKRMSLESLKCNSKEESKTLALKVLCGAAGPALEIVSINSGAALYAAGKAESLGEGAAVAKRLLQEGRVYKKLEAIISFSKKGA